MAFDIKEVEQKRIFRLKRNLKTPFWVDFEFETAEITHFWAAFFSLLDMLWNWFCDILHLVKEI